MSSHSAFAALAKPALDKAAVGMKALGVSKTVLVPNLSMVGEAPLKNAENYSLSEELQENIGVPLANFSDVGIAFIDTNKDGEESK
ncbi:hypothetical protein SK128_021893, partial [Halocaridina rubra]